MLFALACTSGNLPTLFDRLALGGAHSDGLIENCVEAVALSCVADGDEDEGDRESLFDGDAQGSLGDDEGDCSSVDWGRKGKVSVCDGGNGVGTSGAVA